MISALYTNQFVQMVRSQIYSHTVTDQMYIHMAFLYISWYPRLCLGIVLDLVLVLDYHNLCKHAIWYV